MKVPQDLQAIISPDVSCDVARCFLGVFRMILFHVDQMNQPKSMAKIIFIVLSPRGDGPKALNHICSI